MRQILRCAIAISLVFSGISATAQEVINKGDLPDPRTSIDQTPVSSGDVPVVNESSGRARITNANSAASDSSTSARQLGNSNVKDVIQQQSVLVGQSDK